MTLAPDSRHPTSWAGAIGGLGNNLLVGLVFELPLAVRFHQLRFGVAQTRSKPEDMMVAQGIRPGDPRSRAAEFAECIGQIANDRSETAFDVLFRHFAPRIKSYCMRLGADASGAEEITQEAMVSIWRNAAQFDPSRASASTWIFTIARNLSIDRFRKGRRPEFDPNDPALVPEDQQTPDRLVEKTEMEENVRKIMESLSSNQRHVLMLSFYENLSHGEISRQLNLPVGTVKSRIRLAFAKIRSALDASHGAGQ
ncbi:sigma-70 family RNA polymerase sigma factor [Bradyrhizobium sp.]|uniref:sigma-70 family RNA polymerase sigma factor n=1 Tax=Bradyrhizobium sp. TaxID=376 RepID=UPI0025C6DE25|nr:sigma-70 family RNA polymerase sigma factor [Bradyrhizobium sp.]